MSSTSNERSNIGLAHGLPRSGVQRPGEGGPWRSEKPTPIPVPANGTNPFNQLYKSKTKGTSKGERSAVGPRSGGSVHKAMKPRPREVPIEPASKRRRSTEHRSMESSNRLLVAPEDDIIAVDLEEDELGIVEPYTMDEPYRPPSVIQGKASDFTVAPDGPFTRDLQRKVEESDPIEHTPSPIRTGRVQQRVNEIEAKQAVLRPPYPHINLATLQSNKRKPLTGPANNPSKRKQAEESLPVKEYITEHRQIADECRLVWSESAFKLRVGREVAFDVSLETVKSVEWVPPSLRTEPSNAKQCYCIIINSGTLILFDSTHSDWSVVNYDAFKSFLTSRMKSVDCTSITSEIAFKLLAHHRDTSKSAAGEGNRRNSKALPGHPVAAPDPNPLTSPHFPESKGSIKGNREPVTLFKSRSPGEPSRSTNEPTTSASSSKKESITSTVDPIGDAVRRSTRQSISKKPLLDPDEVILVYPFSGPGSVNITNADVARLEPGEFLNDTLIEFGLKLWLARLEEINKELADQVHVFSSFFYKKLNKKPQEEGYNSVRKWTSKFDLFKKKFVIVPINEHMHWYLGLIYEPEHVLRTDGPSSISTPTEKPEEDLMEGPVEEVKEEGNLPSEGIDLGSVSRSEAAVEEDLTDLTQACSLEEFIASASVTRPPSPTAMDIDAAIGPSLAQSPSPSLSYVDPDENTHSSAVPHAKSPIAMSPDIEIMDLRSDPIPPPPPMTSLMKEDSNQEVEADDMNLRDEKAEILGSGIPPESFYGTEPSTKQTMKHSMKRGRGRQSNKPIEIPKPIPNTTYVFTLDSLGTAHRYPSTLLARYLQFEAKDKKGVDSTAQIMKRQAFVPTQPNFCDCGLYLLHLAQTFVSNPQFYLEKSIRPERASTNAERKQDWHDDKVPEMRQNLLKDIKRLSHEWKQLKKEKEKGKGKGKEKAPEKDEGPPSKPPLAVDEDSDEEIQVLDTVPAPKKTKKPPGPSNVITRHQAQSHTTLRPRG